jgi:hypothetical protein
LIEETREAAQEADSKGLGNTVRDAVFSGAVGGAVGAFLTPASEGAAQVIRMEGLLDLFNAQTNYQFAAPSERPFGCLSAACVLALAVTSVIVVPKILIL